MSSIHLTSEKALESLVEELDKLLSNRDVVLLKGPMGVGKTSFTKALLSHYGCAEAVSPTFALHNEYKTNRGVVDHLDLYRLESEEELEGIGFWDLFAKKSGLILIEWPERIPDGQLPKVWSQISIELEFVPGDDQARRGSIEKL
ncbi:MAG: tRNA (adenosine(37)-N6)-threonylcarbamoyltransferase complex ATPase subunit type 1 TsaE [Pseudomonadota bacterium]